MLTCLELLDNNLTVCGLETQFLRISIHLCLKMEAHLKADRCQDEHDFDLCTSASFIFFY